MNADDAVKGAVSILTAIVGVAILAVLVGKSSQTTSVITAIGSSLTSILQAAVSPVTGGGSSGVNTAVSDINALSNINVGGLTAADPFGGAGR